MTKTKLILLGIAGISAVVFSIGKFFNNKNKEEQAIQMILSGNYQGALDIYVDLFVNSFNNLIDEDGDGYPKILYSVMEKTSTKYLNPIKDILDNNGIVFDFAQFDILKEKLNIFLNAKGMMNYQYTPVKEGKIKYAEFYQNFISFIDSIPRKL